MKKKGLVLFLLDYLNIRKLFKSKPQLILYNHVIDYKK